MKNEQRSNVEITLKSGALMDFEMNASVGVVPHLIKEMKATGMLTLWNEGETLCVNANEILHVSIVNVTE